MLTVDDIHVGYGGTRVLHGLSLKVAPGEVLGVCGPNGAGKSTLLRTIAGQLRPSRGEIVYDDASLTRSSVSRIVSLGVALCPEGRQVFPRMSTEANLRLGAYTRRDRRAVDEDVAAYLSRWPVIKRRKDSPAGMLSGGEQQIVAIGRAAMSRPSLLLLDEPSLGLAPVLIDQVYQLLKSLAEDAELSILLVEQNVAKSMEVCDRVAVLNHGRITFESMVSDTTADEVGAHYFTSSDRGVG